MDYKLGHFTQPVRAWFGKDWTPKVNWKGPQQRATRSSADGDNLHIKDNWATNAVPKTKARGKREIS